MRRRVRRQRGGRGKKRFQTGGRPSAGDHSHGVMTTTWVNSETAEDTYYSGADGIYAHSHTTGEAGSHDHNQPSMRRARNSRRRRQVNSGPRAMKRRQMGGNGRCPSGQHWMPPANGRAGYCMQGAYHGASYRRGGRIRRQLGGRSGGLVTPWGGASRHRTNHKK